MENQFDYEKLWTKFLLKLKVQHPFFSTVAMFASFRVDEQIDVAQTLNKDLVISPHFLSSITETERYSYLLHQVLHLALGHIERAQGRDELLWNIAADISVNNIITESTEWPVAPKTAWNHSFSGNSVERIYAILQKEIPPNLQLVQSGEKKPTGSEDNQYEFKQGDHSQSELNYPEPKQPQPHKDTQQSRQTEHKPGTAESDNGIARSDEEGSTHERKRLIKTNSAYRYLEIKYDSQADFEVNNSLKSEHEKTSKEYWRSALIKAKQLNSERKMGKGSATLESEVELAVNGVIDWRPILWKYATPDLVDYHEFDHRFIHAGYYTETLLSESIVVDVVVDTSGSIRPNQLDCFLTEMLNIHACHPDVKLRFFYADNKLYGPYKIPSNINDLPIPIGSGGTSFVPYFKELEKNTSILERPQAVIYFTDGFGEFPETAPSTPVLWLLTEDGLLDEEVPFGIPVRIKE